ncbi:MAG: ATP-binding protein, partial [Campylobacterota bacterium]|nr:ATP-binding protein [Campylobacterota bacterium]
MNGLKQVSLIKSAKFDFAQVDIDGNSLFIGANGAGKTTLLRAILYFYTASSKGLGISSSKKIVFSEYYFEYENSYIAYVYKKDDNYILVTAYNDSGVKFRFTLLNSMPNIKEIYIKDDKPLLKGELFIKLKELGTTSNIIPNGVKYKEVLYSKNHSLRYFSLFEAKEYDGFIKTLSNIFINSKVDSNAIKKVIVSSLGIENTIDLNSISRYLENFNNYFEDIKSYESQQNKIKRVLDILQEYEQTKVLLQDDISTLLNSKQIIEKQYSDISISIDKQTQQKNTLKDKQQHEQNLYIKRKDKLNQSKGACDSFIKLSNSKKNHYEKIDISERIKEYESLPLLNSRLKDIVSKKEFLTKEVGSLQHYHELQLQSIENSFISNTNDQNEKLHSLKQELSSKQNTLKQKEQQDIVNIQEKYTKKLFELKDNRSALLSNIQDEKYNKKDILNNQFIYSEEQKLQTYIQKHTIVTQTINENKQKLILENKELETIENIYHKELEYIKKSFDKDTQELNKKIQAIQKLITPQKDTLAESIYKNTKGDISKYFY